MRVNIIALAALLISTFGCCGRNAQNMRTYTLSSGKQVKVEGVKKMNFPNLSMVEIDYETEIPIEKKEALRKEVDEVWSIFQKDVEGAETKVGIIQATSCSLGGLVRQQARYGFLLSERDGKWHPLEEDLFKEGK
jgi:hypothetical protein